MLEGFLGIPSPEPELKTPGDCQGILRRRAQPVPDHRYPTRRKDPESREPMTRTLGINVIENAIFLVAEWYAFPFFGSRFP